MVASHVLYRSMIGMVSVLVFHYHCFVLMFYQISFSITALDLLKTQLLSRSFNKPMYSYLTINKSNINFDVSFSYSAKLIIS